MPRFTNLEKEAVRVVVDEKLAGDAAGFFEDACGFPADQAEKMAEALQTALVKLT